MSEKQSLEYVQDMLHQLAALLTPHQTTLRHVLAMGALECEVQLEIILTADGHRVDEDSLKVA